MTAEGNDIRKIAGGFGNGVWSPDGSTIAFTRADDNSARYSLYTIDPRTGRLTMLLRKTSVGTPTWSPDGSQIAVDTADDVLGPSAIYVVNSDGSGETLLKQGGGTELAWSP
jgi:Tol biopolymer transport system component